eukprot:COSAG02_NODE_26213_length_636_cov_1.007421_1_plen_110_part_00
MGGELPDCAYVATARPYTSSAKSQVHGSAGRRAELLYQVAYIICRHYYPHFGAIDRHNRIQHDLYGLGPLTMRSLILKQNMLTLFNLANTSYNRRQSTYTPSRNGSKPC